MIFDWLQSLCDLKVVTDTASVNAYGAVSVDVLANDVGDGLHIVDYQATGGGDLFLDQNQNLVYVADAAKFDHLRAGQSSREQILYEVQDARGHIAIGQLSVTVNGGALATDIVGTHKGELLVGTDAGERIFAGGGADIVAGQGGSDTLYGSSGSDQMFGGDGDDLMVAGGGADWMTGDYGNDTLIGGHGADTFAFADFWGHDVVVGFDARKDVIQLPSVYFGKLQDVLSAAHDDGHGNLVISTPSHDGAIDTLTLLNVRASTLHASNFVFV